MAAWRYASQDYRTFSDHLYENDKHYHQSDYNDFYDIGLSLISEAERVSGKLIDDRYRKFLCSFYVEAISGILYNWIKSDMSGFSRAEIIDYITSAVGNSLKGIMDEYEVFPR